MSTILIPDAEARLRACDPSKSFIIRAPAGSGKTTLLIERMITLLYEVDHPKRILAITFTRKAAEEMQQRLLDVLSDPAHPLHERARRLGWPWSLHAAPVDILTIDAWIQSWLPHQRTIHPMPEWLYQEAWAHWLSLHRHTDALTTLLPLFKGQLNALEHWMIQALTERAMWIFDIGNTTWSTLMPQRQDQLLLRWERELLRQCGNLEHYLAQITEPTLPKKLPNPGAHADWQILARWLLNQKGDYRSRFSCNLNAVQKKELKDCLAEWPKRTLSLWQYLYHGDTPQNPEILDATQQILKELLASLYLIFERHQSSDFTEHLIQSIQAVRDAADPMQLEHLLLDEAQDTAPIQMKLIETLTAHWRNPTHSIFIVGDPMQSIYRFRDADVRSFLVLSEHGFAHHSLIPLTLSSNFRQSPKLTAYINELFSELMSENLLDEGAISFSPSTSLTTLPGHIEPHPNVADSIDHEKNILTRLKIEHPHERIGILVRARQQGHHFLEQEDIHAQEMMDALHAPRLVDALELLIFLSDPHDSLSWLHLLRSPWVGLSLLDCARHHRRLTDPSESKHPAIQALLTPLKSPYSLRILWIEKMKELGLLAHCSASEIEVLARLAQHLDTWYPTLGALSRHYLYGLLKKERLSFSPAGACAHLMSVHKSKGLEFDHVYLPQLHRREKSQALSSMILTSVFEDNRPCALLWHACQPGPSWLSQLLKKQSDYEYIRLLYVAMTRAKRSLWLSASGTGGWAKWLLPSTSDAE